MCWKARRDFSVPFKVPLLAPGVRGGASGCLADRARGRAFAVDRPASGADALATLAATSLEHRLRRHPLAETVVTLALDIAGLESPLHGPHLESLASAPPGLWAATERAAPPAGEFRRENRPTLEKPRGFVKVPGPAVETPPGRARPGTRWSETDHETELEISQQFKRKVNPEEIDVLAAGQTG